MIRCFVLEPTARDRLYLRRYRHSDEDPCPEMPGKLSYHQARTPIGTARCQRRPYCRRRRMRPHDDPRWPKRCVCGARFRKSDHWQVFTEHVYRRADTGETTTLRDAPAGAMWFAGWMDVDRWKGPDGQTLMCRLPGGHDWMIDGVASNCTKPDDHAHRCWVRRGTPPDVTVDKNGNTCAAGAGSIAVDGYHGFLQNGHLT